VDFQLSEDQEALQAGVRSFCEGRVPVEQLAVLEEKQAFDRELWGELAELGVFGLRLTEEQGGVGLGVADAVLVFAELGRRLVPGPLLWSHLLASRIDGAESGETVVGGLDLCGSLDGSRLVEHLESLDCLIALRPDGLYRIEPRDLQATPVATPLDPLTPVHHIAALPEGERIGAADDVEQLRREGAVLSSALLLGIAEATLELAVDYAGKREQFGRVIGGFQAVKHILADMFVRQEAARAAVYAGGATLDDPEVGDLDRAAASAKLIAGSAAMSNSRACIQVHGGMGYTWEVPAHYYLKRTWVLESLFGTIEDHETTMAACVEANL
jgi:alkylation response protein AidB-like acyl-CoA dehydrogenase